MIEAIATKTPEELPWLNRNAPLKKLIHYRKLTTGDSEERRFTESHRGRAEI